jgi:hypothetical protein
MWNTDSLWVEVSAISFFLLLGHIFFGHFEERSPKLRKLLKAIGAIILMVLLSIYFGRSVAFAVMGLWIIPLIYIHGVWLPKKGINGWTGEPKSRYYELRGWSKDIFGDTE